MDRGADHSPNDPSHDRTPITSRGGNDTYVNPVAGVANDSNWYAEPINPESGQMLDPTNHKAIGIDR